MIEYSEYHTNRDAYYALVYDSFNRAARDYRTPP